MSNLYAIIEAHYEKYGVRPAEIARRMGTSPQTISSWKNRGLKHLPDKRLLEALSRVTGTPWEIVRDAALSDIGYLKEGEEHGDGSAPIDAPQTEYGT